MKRSKSVALTLMVGTAALSLAGCGDGVQPTPAVQDFAFGNASECVVAGFDLDGCSSTYQRALASHTASAPRYATEPECEDATDADCVTARFPNVDGSVTTAWVPKMDGFMFTADADGGWQTGQAQAETSGGSGGSGGIVRHYYAGIPLYSSRSHSGSRIDLPSVKAFASAPKYGRTAPVPVVRSFGAQSAAYVPSSSGSSKFTSSSLGNARTSAVSRGGMSGGGRGGSAGG